MIEIGQHVTWKPHNSQKLTGKLTEVIGQTGYVMVAGSTHLVPVHLLGHATICCHCGKNFKPSRRYVVQRQRFCSQQCHKDSVKKDTDEWVFGAIVEYKTKYGGRSPSIENLCEWSGMSDIGVRRSIERLVAANRIIRYGAGRYKHFDVPGGRWVYEGDS